MSDEIDAPRLSFAQGLAWFAREIGTDTKALVTRLVSTAADPLSARLDALEQGLAELQAWRAERPGMKHCKTWQSGREYMEGDVVTRDGSMWTCVANHVKSTPGVDHTGWVLSCKRGRDGRDGKDLR